MYDRDSVLSFCLWIVSFPSTIYWKDHPFPIVYSWCPCQRLSDRFMCGIISGICSLPLVYMSVYMPIPYCFNCWSFVIYFEVRKCDTSSFVLLYQDCFGYSWSFTVSYEFYNFFFYFCKKFHWTGKSYIFISLWLVSEGLSCSFWGEVMGGHIFLFLYFPWVSVFVPVHYIKQPLFPAFMDWPCIGEDPPISPDRDSGGLSNFCTSPACFLYS